jgi:hypothetical protein
MMEIQKEVIDLYYVQVEGQERQVLSGICNACKCKFYGEYARDRHLKSQKHQMFAMKWSETHIQTDRQSSVINFVV